MAEQKWIHTDWDKCFSDMIPRALEAAGMQIVSYAILNTPIKDGRLVGSITWATQSGGSNTRPPASPGDGVSTPTNDYTLHVGTNVEYAEVVEYGGSRTYIIEPKEKKALYWKGAAHPVKRVVHPPNPAFPFLRPAFDDNRKEIAEIFAEALRGGIRRHGK